MSLPDDPVSPGVPPSGEPLQIMASHGMRLEWERWNLREDPRRWAKLFLSGEVVLLVGVALVMSLPVTAAVALGLALVVTLLPYLLPRHFELEASGISIRQGFYASRREWCEIEGYRKEKGGYLLQLRPKPGSKPPRPNLLSPGSKELFLPFPLEPEKLPLLESVLRYFLKN